MTAIYPIPTTRSSGVLVRQRLLAQLQSDQLALLRTQDQLSTGRRIIVPSDDAPAALRAVGLQKLLEQKGQARTNLGAAQSYLGATDNALSGVSDLIRQVRATALGAVSSTVSETERRAAAEEVMRTLEQLISIGNQQFRGRSLFAGSSGAAAPFERINDYVVYHGNETALQSFADVGLLTETSVSGHVVFGAFSAEKQGTADFNPPLREQTRLSDLHRGLGIRAGSFTISDGAATSTIDIRGAETVGDVLRLIERNPPPGRQITARIVDNHLELRLDAAGGGNLMVREVGGGTTAAELGILANSGVGSAPLVGADLDPRLRGTTPLDGVLGTRAFTRLESPGWNNDLVLTARERGEAGNGYTIQIVDDSLLRAGPGLSAGNETAELRTEASAARASLALLGGNNDLVLEAVVPGVGMNNVAIVFDSSQNLGDAAVATFNGDTLTLQIDDDDQTTLASLIDAIEATGLFTVAADPSAGEGHDPGSAVLAANAGAVTGNTGVSGGEANTLFVRVRAGESTAAQVAAALAADAAIAALFEVRFDSKDALPTLNPGAGIVAAGASAVTAGGGGVELDLASGLQITNGGTTYVVDVADARTVEDLLNRLNGSPAQVLATINEQGDGIVVRSRLSGADFHIGENGGLTATHLGIRTFTAETPLAELNHGLGVAFAAGADFTLARRDGVELEIDLSGAATIAEVLARINAHPDNLDPATAVTARLATQGNGIELVDANGAGPETLRVVRGPNSTAAWDLGLIPKGADSAAAEGEPQTLRGRDPHPLETEGVFNTLLRLHQAIETGDLPQLERTVALLDDDLNRLLFSRAEIGARQRSLDTLQQRLENEEISLKAALSLEIDADLVETISNLSAQQATFQASLQTISQTFRLSLLDFL